jgi:hypothetical protein
LVIAKSGAGFDTASARAIPPAPNSKPAATTILRISHQIGFTGRAPKSYQEHLPRSLSTRHYKLNTSLASFSQTPPRTEGHKGAIATFSISSPVPTCLRRRARSSRAELLWSPRRISWGASSTCRTFHGTSERDRTPRRRIFMSASCRRDAFTLNPPRKSSSASFKDYEVFLQA